MSPVLKVENLHVSFQQDGRQVPAVRGVSFEIGRGETVALVGESGSGKSVTALSTVGLLPGAATVSGSIVYEGEDLAGAPEKRLRQVRGNDISFIFQEPMTSLNPLHTLEKQIAESLALHQGLTGAAARARILELLARVGIRDPESRLGAYPHQLSGGQRQRVMIAMALACQPRLLIADEPTTALDVTIQAQILDLLQGLQQRTGMALILITHDMGVVAETAQRVQVQYAGQKVEEQPVRALFETPHHPYTAALLAALPERATERRLPTIPGVVPGQFDRPEGCLFSPRCRFADDTCRHSPPPVQPPALGIARCHYPLDTAATEAAR